jgi:APA family basic amino acid/polyamine antiporter
MTASNPDASHPAEAPSRLGRRLRTADAVVIGLGAMIGAGVFSAVGPAARVAGNGLLLGLLLAAAVAYCNATSTAQLAALHPESGGAYVYGRKRLGAVWGFLAGWCFIVGKVASCAAMAMTFASYAAPGLLRPLALGAVLVATTLNCLGVRSTAVATRIIVALVLGSLGVATAAIWLGGATDTARLWPLGEATFTSVLQSAGVLFFAFAGYARVATLGEEVVDPARTIPRAISIALTITFVVYVTVAISALVGVDAATLGHSAAPLASAVEAGRLAALSPAVRFGAVLASLGVLLSLTAGIGRTMFAMASSGDLPRFLSAVHPRSRIPVVAQVVIGVVVSSIVAVADVRSAIGFSSFAVLLYYSVANAAALTLGPAERRRARWIPLAGLVGCVVVAVSLPASSVIGGSVLVIVGACAHLASTRWQSSRGGHGSPGDRPG